MKVDFYHLTTSPLERVLPRIAERILAEGGRLLVVEGDPARRAALDKTLWSYAPDSFLPHGLAGGDHDRQQPVLIAPDMVATNEARNVAIADGEWRNGALGFDRAFHFFDEDRIADARTAWKGLAARDDIERRYWKQSDTGRWEQAA
ncbi:DNA polymerase III, chi subunit [Sphingomonas palmae]|uniref:DNA polymerase III, chi subunit n=1 Tax=Sphingomonas palmae TaxID=1855283 RepID=A0A1H7G6C9_9SPHN|nr:DNA polymerase III subunit chi [Sphingomonas palmae]SEK33689.1 DNA polymerase III, chi subunit [Sphingomonas palmae]